MKYLPAILFAAIASAGVAAMGQQEAEPSSTPAAPAILPLRVGAAGGIRQYVTGRWGEVIVEIANSSDEDTEMLVTSNLKGSRRQFGRRLWVPANSKRRSTYSMFFDVDPEGERYELQSRVLRGDGSESLLKDQKSMLHEGTLAKADDRIVSAILMDRIPISREREELALFEAEPEPVPFVAVQQLRLRLNHSKRVTQIQDEPLPTTAASLNGLDNLTIAGNRLLKEPATMAAVRKWLLEGGRVWIMLDRVDLSVVQALSGEAFDAQVVDEIDLEEVTIKPVEGPPGPPRRYSEPVRMKRVIATSGEVTHEVDGWPACYFLPVGRGVMMITTLGAPGWMLERLNVVTKDPELVATEDMAQIGQRFFAGRPQPLMNPVKLESYLMEQIGYRIADRTWIVAILGGFCMLLVVAGWVLSRRHRLEWISVVGGLLAMATTAALLLLGFYSKQSVPPTLAMEQWVDATSSFQTTRVEGLLAVYNDQPSSAEIGARHGSQFDLDLSGLEGQTRRLIFTDYNAWQWENLTLPDGVRKAPFVSYLDLVSPLQATGRLGPDGLRGVLHLERFESPADAVLVTPANGNLALQLDGNEYVMAPDSILPPDRFFAGSLLSDTQRRRQDLLRSMIAGKTGGDRLLTRPAILTWTKPADLGFEFPDQQQRVGEALVAVPLRLERSLPGPVTIPLTFLPYRLVGGPGRPQPLSIYNQRTGEWTGDLSVASAVWLEFSIPPQLRPLRVKQARLRVTMEATNRKVVFVALKDGKSVDVGEKYGISGTTTIVIDDPELLELTDGKLMLGFEMSSSAGGRVVKWSVKRLQLDLSGDVLNP